MYHLSKVALIRRCFNTPLGVFLGEYRKIIFFRHFESPLKYPDTFNRKGIYIVRHLS